jgi:hypothetical protein
MPAIDLEITELEPAKEAAKRRNLMGKRVSRSMALAQLRFVSFTIKW